MTTSWSQIVLKFSFTIRKKMVQNMMFVSHSPLEKRIVSVFDKIRHSRHVLITEPSTNSTTDESTYALTVGNSNINSKAACLRGYGTTTLHPYSCGYQSVYLRQDDPTKKKNRKHT